MIDLEESLTASLQRRADVVMVRDDLGEILAGATVIPFRETKGARRGGRLMLVAAATVLIAAAAGTAWAQITRTDPGSTAQEPAVPVTSAPGSVVAPRGVPLSSVDSIAADEWLWPTVLPDGFRYQYPERLNDAKTLRFFVSPSSTNQIHIWLSPAFASSDSGDLVSVAGRSWSISGPADSAQAEADIGDQTVSIGGAIKRADLIAMIEGLIVVKEGQLQSPPLTYPDVAVGTFDLHGQDAVVNVRESNGWYCIGTQSAAGGSSGCASYMDLSEKISWPGGGAYDYAEDSSTLTMSTWGMASADVASVEVDFIGGVTASVVPQNTSGQFPDRRFWVVGAEADSFVGNPSGITQIVVEVRAYDSEGTLLATRRSDDPVSP